MTKQEAIELIKKHLFTKNGTFSTSFRSQRQKLINSNSWYVKVKEKFLDNILPDYPNDDKFDKLRIFLFLTENDNVKTLPKCTKCGREVFPRTFSLGFPKTCTDRNCQGPVDKVIIGTISLMKNSTTVSSSEIQEILDQVCDKSGRIQSSRVKKFLENYTNVKKLKDIMEKRNISFISEINSKTLNEILYCIENNISERPKCPICGKNVSFISRTSGYAKTCDDKNCQAKYNLKQRIYKRVSGKKILLERTDKKRSWKKVNFKEN